MFHFSPLLYKSSLWLRNVNKRRLTYTFTMFRPILPENCPFPWGSGLPSNTLFLRPTLVLNPNGISIASVFTGLTSVTDWQTDRPTDRPRCSVGDNSRIYVRSTAMRRNNAYNLINTNWNETWRTQFVANVIAAFPTTTLVEVNDPVSGYFIEWLSWRDDVIIPRPLCPSCRFVNGFRWTPRKFWSMFRVRSLVASGMSLSWFQRQNGN